MKRTKRLTRLALLAALALVLSYLESLLPSPGIPGVKLGLANVAVVCALYWLGPLSAAAISLVRVVTVSLLFGSFPALAYSLAGAVLSLAVMSLVKKTGWLSPLGVSVLGGVTHNLGQVLMAALLLETPALLWYYPLLLVSGTLAGVFIGALGGLLLRRGDLVEDRER